MNKCIKVFVQLAVTLTFISAAYADKAAVTKALAKSMPSVKVDSIKPAAVKGLFEVVVGTAIYYVSEDGKYLLQGRLVDIAAHKDLTEEKLNSARKLAIEKIGQANMIVFKPKIAKYKVTIFTDIDCGYCRKLHTELQSYLDAGITVRYLAFPRGGLNSDTFNDLQSVWCAKDKQKAMNEAKSGADIAALKCDSPVAKQFELGHSFGISGTPAIVLPDGSLIPGYQSATQLAAALASTPKS